MSIPSGALRFNSDSGKLEYYNGEDWWQIDSFTPDSATGGARGVFGGGFNAGNNNTIDYITISTTGNALDFGDLLQNRRNYGACSSTTRGVFGGGAAFDGVADRTNTVDFVTISSTGNAQDFGDLTQTRRAVTSCSSSTRGLFAGGNDDISTNYNIIDYITITSTGDAKDFGDLLSVAFSVSACSSSTRGVFGGGDPGVNVIQYVTIASLGNALDFGDLTTVKTRFGACSSPTRGVFGGGYTAPAPASASSNIMDYVTIMSTGNAIDFGDLFVGRHQNTACSNGHGGL